MRQSASGRARVAVGPLSAAESLSLAVALERLSEHPIAKAFLASGTAGADAVPATDIRFCAIDDPGCEACQ